MASSPPVPRLKKMVEYVLDENPKYRNVEARNSDIVLTIIIWQRWYNVSEKPDGVVHLYRLLDLPREDNVKRVRAVLQNVEHKYLPTDPNILIKRGIEQEYWEQALGYKLTKDEWARHHQTLKEIEPPKIADNRPAVYGDTTASSEPENPGTILELEYLGMTAGNLIKGKRYQAKMPKIEVFGKIKLILLNDNEARQFEYLTIKDFNRSWKVIKK